MRNIRFAIPAVALVACAGDDGAEAIGQRAAQLERSTLELCGNGVDDDGDGAIDEQQCLISEGSGPISDGGIVPEAWDDNPNCSQLGYGYGFKIDQSPNGTFYFTSAYGSLTGGAPQDATNYVTISGSDGTTFGWSSSLGIDAVLVKGGPIGGNLYVYSPEGTGDSGLGTPGGYGISHIELCYDYGLTASKTAEAEWRRSYAWEIKKGVEPAALWMFAGEQGAASYEVGVDRTSEDSGHRISGSITVSNPTPFTVPFTLSDTIDEGVGAPTVSCPASELPPGGSVVCTYAVEPAGALGSLNTVTVASGNPSVEGASATAPIVWGDPVVEGFETVFVDDTSGPLGPASGDRTWEYELPFACPSDPGAYVDGYLAYDFDNTATILETGAEASASITIHCYAPVSWKVAETAYTRQHDWRIRKTVSPAHHEGFAGDSFSSGYQVSVEESVDESGFRVFGAIQVMNPHPFAPMALGVADAIGAVPAELSCGGVLVVPPLETATCSYVVNLGDGDRPADGLNQAQLVFNGIAFSASAPFVFGDPTETLGFPAIQVTDTQPSSGAPWATSASASWSYPAPFSCPSDPSLYVDGLLTLEVPNRAQIAETGQFADAGVTVVCRLPAQARVVKHTVEGSEDIGAFPFQFSLVSPSGAVVEAASLGGAGELGFATELRTPGLWKVIEGLPAGWVNPSTVCSFEVSFPSSAGQIFACEFTNVEKGRVRVVKHTDGVVDPTRSWSFGLFEGPDGFGGSPLGTASTLGDADGELAFPALDPDGTYTLCELGIAAGWTSVWRFDTDGDGVAETIVVPYNPDENDAPPQDLGNRCVDLGANTELELTAGESIYLEIDNLYPGGSPRTPGYWKNWNRCSGGGQAANAARNGGWAEGFWLLDDVLDPAIGGGVVWDDLLVHSPDIAPYAIAACTVAVDILDQRDVGDPAVAGDGRKMASDAAYTLAMHLLAAQLNFGAGAQTCPAALSAALEGEKLLDKVNFRGTGSYLRRGADYALALQLASTLDAYNNGELCGAP